MLKWLLWFEPDQHRALLITGISLNADRRFAEAVDVLARIPEDSKSFREGGLALGASLISGGQLERAETVLKRQLTLYPETLETHRRLVQLYLGQLRQRDAVLHLVDRWQRFPDDLSVLPDLLELQVRSVLPQDRVELLETADTRHPGQAPVLLALGRAFAMMGRTEAARERFQAALSLRPDDPWMRLWAAEFFLDCGDVEFALTLMTGSSSSPDVFTPEHRDDRYWALRCRIAEQLGEPAQAEAFLRQALDMRPYDESSLLMHAALLRQLGRADEAVEPAKRAQRIAEARKQLMIQFDALDRDHPDPAVCRSIAGLLDAIGESRQAADWQRVVRAAAERDRSRSLQ